MLETSQSAVRRYEPRPTARVRLFCLPHAGGSASFFRPWSSLLPPDIELCAIQYPGREDRWNEPAHGEISALITDLVDGIAPWLDLPFFLFGHSLGGLVAYETALALRRDLGRDPVHLFVSAKEPPQHHRADDFHLRSDAELCTELSRLLPGHEDVLQDPEVRSILLPAVRADYRVDETYEPTVAPPLACPITAFCADADTETTLSEIQGWRQRTSGRYSAIVLPGDHFYLVPHRSAVVSAIERTLVHGNGQ